MQQTMNERQKPTAQQLSFRGVHHTNEKKLLNGGSDRRAACQASW